MAQEYVLRALYGDHEAFERLYDRYASAALRLSVSITRDSAIAEDAVQEAFLRVFKKGRQFRQSERFEPWFFRIVVNESKRAAKRYPVEKGLDENLGVPAFTDQSDLSVMITSAMEMLSEDHRTVLALKFLLDYSEADIARIIKKPVGTVKSRIYYAKKSLAEIMNAEGSDFQ